MKPAVSGDEDDEADQRDRDGHDEAQQQHIGQCLRAGEAQCAHAEDDGGIERPDVAGPARHEREDRRETHEVADIEQRELEADRARREPPGDPFERPDGKGDPEQLHAVVGA